MWQKTFKSSSRKSRALGAFLAALFLFLASAGMALSYAEDKGRSADDFDLTRITSKGRLVIDYENKTAEFFDTVEVQDRNGTMKSNYLKVIFTADGSNVSKMIATGNVVITQKDRTAYSDNAIYIVQTEVLRLIGNPKITEKGNMYTADEITILIKQNKVLFEPSARIVIKDTRDAAASQEKKP